MTRLEVKLIFIIKAGGYIFNWLAVEGGDARIGVVVGRTLKLKIIVLFCWDIVENSIKIDISQSVRY